MAVKTWKAAADSSGRPASKALGQGLKCPSVAAVQNGQIPFNKQQTSLGRGKRRGQLLLNAQFYLWELLKEPFLCPSLTHGFSDAFWDSQGTQHQLTHPGAAAARVKSCLYTYFPVPMRTSQQDKATTSLLVSLWALPSLQ